LTKQTGLFAHNYLDNFVNNTIKDSFLFNTFALFEMPYELFTNGDPEWPSISQQFQYMGNTFEHGVMHNRIHGWSMLSTFGNWFQWNYADATNGTQPTYIVDCHFGSSFIDNLLPPNFMRWTTFQSRSCNSQDLTLSSRLGTRFAKEVKATVGSGSYNASTPIMVWWDDSATLNTTGVPF